MPKNDPPRIAWALSGSGHYLKECLDIVRELDHVDLFMSEAAQEVVRMYGYDLKDFKPGCKVHRDNTASAVPVMFLYQGNYRMVVLAPVTSNTVAKCVAGISDTLVTNFYAQAGKCRIPSIVYACDTAPALISDAPGQQVWVYPRPIDLENVERLSSFRDTQVVLSIEALRQSIADLLSCPSKSSSSPDALPKPA
ncbi:MAG: flavoprotein [Betaproteobacteria bacterium]|nr:flavoprotein [Betaproteobacteria bacterium]